jgi:hypothetical protein
MKQTEKQINKEEFIFYRKRILNLFKAMINNNNPDDLSDDVKYTYNTFIKSAINYFKIIDNNDLLQDEYKEIEFPIDISSNDNMDTIYNYDDANKLMMRSVKMDLHTLDKYVKRTTNKKHDNIILPKSREVDITKPEFKNKGIKDIDEKKNITIIYEDNQKDKK